MVAPKPTECGRPKDPELTSRRREQILDAAAKRFARLGFQRMDVQELADELQVGKGTVYRYFPTKERLFMAAVERGVCRLEEAIEANISRSQDPLEQIRLAIEAYLNFFRSNPEVCELLLQERAGFKDSRKPTYFVRYDAQVGKWRDRIGGLIRQGRVREVPVERINDVISDLVYGTMFTNYFAGQRKCASDQTQDIVDIVFRGILSESERARQP